MRVTEDVSNSGKDSFTSMWAGELKIYGTYVVQI